MTPDIHMSEDNTDYTITSVATPSADYIHAISEFFDTDPSDLLAELGYYDRSAATPSDEYHNELAIAQE
jgi:hypothetical protein